MIEQRLGISISTRGNRIMFRGPEGDVQKGLEVVEDLRRLRRGGRMLRAFDLGQMLDSVGADDKGLSLSDLLNDEVAITSRKGLVTPKTRHQREYIQAIKDHDITFGIGPAGTGKTYLAMALAIDALLQKRVSRVVLARPAVEAGEKLGFLPGDMYDKVNPYLRPLYDALYDMLDVAKANSLVEHGTIEIAPLAFMRGRTLNDSFIILDEAQNTTSEQMKMYLTRLGFNSKTVITGDTSQIDLPSGKKSGLVEAEELLGNIEGIKVVYFSDKDVVRHKLVKKIVLAYESYERRKKEEDKA